MIVCFLGALGVVCRMVARYRTETLQLERARAVTAEQCARIYKAEATAARLDALELRRKLDAARDDIANLGALLAEMRRVQQCAEEGRDALQAIVHGAPVMTEDGYSCRWCRRSVEAHEDGCPVATALRALGETMAVETDVEVRA